MGEITCLLRVSAGDRQRVPAIAGAKSGLVSDAGAANRSRTTVSCGAAPATTTATG